MQAGPNELFSFLSILMEFPVFKRRHMAFDMANYYATNPDVYVYGSPDCYRSFAKLLREIQVPTKIPDHDGWGMDLLVLPPAGIRSGISW